MDVPDPALILFNTLNGYVDEFRSHQNSVQALLKGTLDDHEPLLPSFIPPASYWTSSEKDLFFHGLSIYSRWRPDLIATHIKSKTTFDVRMYLDALETAKAQVVNDKDRLEPFSRVMMAPAMEVSERWIKREEDIAACLMGLDVCPWSLGDLEEGEMKGQKTCKCHGWTRERQRGEESEEDEVLENQNEYMNHLDSTCLMVMENIIREGEVVGSSVVQKSAQAMELDSPESVASNILSEMLPPNLEDPVLPVADPSPSSSKPAGSFEPIQTESELRRRLQKRLYMRRKRAEAAGRTVISDLGKLRPGRELKARKPSKPRPHKYKPKKIVSVQRVTAHAVSPSLASTPAAHSEAGDAIDAGSAAALDGDADAEIDTNLKEAESMYEGHSKGGATRPYRIKKLFQEEDVDAEIMSEMDLHFFHLSTLARLLRLYNSLNDPSRSLDAISISVDCIQLLRVITKEFTSEVVRRAIVTKEQEIRLKSNLKVWKYGTEEISSENIAQCLRSMSLHKLNKQRYFADLLEETVDPVPSKATTNGEVPVEAMDVRDQYHLLPVPPSLPYLANLPHCDAFTSDDILPDYLDEDALQLELKEDRRLNGIDKKLSTEYEQALWKDHIGGRGMD